VKILNVVLPVMESNLLLEVFLRVFVRVSKRKDPPVLEDTCEGRKDARFVSYSLNGTEDGVLVAVPN
jgi:hypothetical protein